MRNNNFWGAYILVFIAQLLLSNYFAFSPWVMATVLPAMVLCIPLSIGAVGAMLIAFVTGMGVDLLSEGIIGLNALAVVPVAFVRNNIIDIVFGQDLIVRKKAFSIRRNGAGPVALALALALALYLVIFIWAESAGTRSFGFTFWKFCASFGVSLGFGLLAIRAMAPDSR